MREGKGFLLVFNVMDNSTFTEVKTLHDKIIRAKDVDKFPLVLAGNKSDLRSSKTASKEVSKEEAKELASDWKCPYIETSAKSGHNADAAFYEVVKEIRRQQKQKEGG